MKNADAQVAKTYFQFPLKAKLQRFEVIEGKEQRLSEWMGYLRGERNAAVATLEDEKMYFEAVFSEKNEGRTYAFWLTLQGEGGKPVESSNHELDRKHMEFWNECIKRDSRKVLNEEFYLTPKFLDEAIIRHQQAEKRSSVFRR